MDEPMGLAMEREASGDGEDSPERRHLPAKLSMEKEDAEAQERGSTDLD